MGFTFGTQPAAGTQPQTGFSFGQQNQPNAQAPATGGFSFGNNTAQQPAASKPLFGAPAQNTGFGTTTFGTKPAGSMFGNANSFGAAGTVKPGELTEKQKAGTVAIACQDIYYNLEDQVGKFNELSQSCAEIDKQNY